MTCVVATLDNHGKIIMGADSSAVDETIHTPHIDPKVFIKGEFGIGYCHSFRMGQILQFWFTPPEIPENEKDMMRYMVMDFIPELKGVLADQDYPFHDDEKIDWSIIVGVRGKLFTVESDWHVGHDGIPYAAVGAGSPYALGAMHSIHGESAASKVALIALETAEKFSPYVLGPFNFIEV